MLLKDLPEIEVLGAFVLSVPRSKVGIVTEYDWDGTHTGDVIITWNDGTESSWWYWQLELQVIDFHGIHTKN